MKNALERGENIEKIKKSFAAAGYKKTQIDALTQQAQAINPNENQIQTQQFQKLPPQKKSVSKTFLIILFVIGILILIIAGIIGFFWEQVSQFFNKIF